MGSLKWFCLWRAALVIKNRTHFLGVCSVNPSQFGPTLFQFSFYLVFVAADLS